MTRGREHDRVRFRLPRVLHVHVRSRRHTRLDDRRRRSQHARRRPPRRVFDGARRRARQHHPSPLRAVSACRSWSRCGRAPFKRFVSAARCSWRGSARRACIAPCDTPTAASASALDPMPRPPRSHAAAYVGDGLGINLLSPVIISYYLSVVPSFIPAGASRFYYSGLAATHVGLAVACHAMWATALDAMRRWFVAPWTRRALAGCDRYRADRARHSRHRLSRRLRQLA